ncbi:hypothetical protein [Ferirhizobium litorale]|uniref:Uncharacterized protein n=1 Tax=Ferirhizobium litorale TaxID=2927786 RepID=A0AAE3U2X2_9HYPH|nr:hypothetical protein [Fererhizobium litorale]MDI7924564.1 hypothetical protein [Fererhizobium litorale]
MSAILASIVVEPAGQRAAQLEIGVAAAQVDHADGGGRETAERIAGQGRVGLGQRLAARVAR